MRAIESIEAVSIIRNNIDSNATDFGTLLSNTYLQDRYHKKIQEFEFLDFSQAQTIVIVGTGPFPETLIFLAENTNAQKVIGLDINQEAIFIGGEMVNSLGLEHISLEHKDGMLFNYKDADIVYIAGFVPVKKEILKRIEKTGKSSVQIVIDSPLLLSRFLYEEITDENIPSRLFISKEINCSNALNNQRSLKIQKFNF